MAEKKPPKEVENEGLSRQSTFSKVVENKDVPDQTPAPGPQLLEVRGVPDERSVNDA